MDIRNLIKSRKYLKRIYIWMTALILSVLIIYSSIIFYQVEQAETENIYQSNMEVLSQMKYNIDFMDQRVRSFCLSAYFNSDVTGIMYGNKNEDLADIITRMNRFNSSVIETNPFIHSVYIYNSNHKQFYSSYQGVLYKDEELMELIKSKKLLPLDKPIFRKISYLDSNGKKIDEGVLTYFYTDNRSGYESDSDGAVFVNVKFTWITDNIKQINDVDKKGDDNVYIFTKDGESVYSKDSDAGFSNLLMDTYSSYMESNQDIQVGENGSFTDIINNKKYLITYTNIVNTDLTLLKAQPFSEVNHNVDKLQTTIIITTVIFLLCAFILSGTVSFNIYRPIRNLVNHLKTEQAKKVDDSENSDEIGLLYDVFKQSVDSLQKSRMEMLTNKNILKTFYLRKLILDSRSILMDDLNVITEQGYVSLDLDQPMAVCVLRMDHFKDMELNFGSGQHELYKFAAANIISEIVSDYCSNEILDMKKDQLVMMMNVHDHEADFYLHLKNLLTEAQQHIQALYKITVTSSTSSSTYQLAELTEKYHEALNNSEYRFFYGTSSNITADMVTENNHRFMDINLNLEKKLVEEMKYGNMNYIEAALAKTLTGLAKIHYNDIQLSVVHLVNTIKTTAEEIMRSRMESVQFNVNRFNEALDCETVEELQSKLMECFQELLKGEGKPSNGKQTILVETIKDMVSVNYADTELCLRQIADSLKMSSVYVGRVFKDIMQISVADYITQVRMNKAVELIETSNLNVVQIMNQVGIENESHFYKHFKKRYGTTPKEYLAKSVRSS